MLTKEYEVSPDLLDDRSPSLSDVIGCEIDWKESKNLPVTEIKKKQKAKSGRNKGQVRTVVSTQPKPSFFNFFSKPMDEQEEADLEDSEEAARNEGREEEERTKMTMEEDYDVGHSIRTALIPEAIQWYTGEANEGEYDDDDMYGEEGDEEDEVK